MRILTVLDLLVVLLLFAIGSIAACSGDPLAILAVPPAVGAAVGLLAGRLQRGLRTGVAIDIGFVVAALLVSAI
jgi:hypothetical protein